MKKIWMRMGADVFLTDEEYNELMKAQSNGDYEKLEEIVEKMTRTCILSGETYILGKNNGFDYNDYDNPDEEISVLF